MKFFKFIFLLFIFSACEDLSFTDEDFISLERQSVSTDKSKETLNTNEKQNFEEDTIIVSEDLELKEDTTIKGKKVILDMVKIQTNEHSLTIIAKEFLSNHSVIQNFPEGQKAQKREDGKSGGDIFILAYKAQGNLKLILNGEDGGRVSKRRTITKEEKQEIKGINGKNGRGAIYKKFCEKESFLFLTNRRCRWECVLKQTKGEDGGAGKQGFAGEDGKFGGDTGSFHLKAYSLLDFHLEEIKKVSGLGSEGGKGSFGGFGGKAGRNGGDDKRLCGKKLPKPESGAKGRKGKKGEAGKNGVEKLVCLEVLDNPVQVYEQIEEIIKTDSLLLKPSQLEEIKNKEGVICY